MSPYICGDNSTASEGVQIAWSSDKIDLLEARLELAEMKGLKVTQIDGHAVLVDYGKTMLKALRLEMRERLKVARVPKRK